MKELDKLSLISYKVIYNYNIIIVLNSSCDNAVKSYAI